MINTKKLNILVAAKNRIVCEGICRILCDDPQNNPTCCEDLTADFNPEILLFEYNQSIFTILDKFPNIKLILLDTHLKDHEIAYLFTYFKIRGIIPSDSSVALFLKAMRMVQRGELWIDQSHLKTLLLRNGTINEKGGVHSLTTKDRQIVKLVSQGLKNKQVADRLRVSEHTVKAYINRIYKKLGVANRAQLTSLAKDNFIDEQPF